MTRYNSLIVIILVGLSFISCDPGKWMNYYGYDFYIRNDSGVPVKMDWGLGLKRIEPDGRQGTNDFDFPKDPDRREDNTYRGYQGYTDFDDDSFNTTGWI